MDINDWVLAYPGVNFPFGRLSTTYPFETQVSIGDTTLVTGDLPHPTADGTTMGADRLGGFTLTFKVLALPLPSDTGETWDGPLDRMSMFRSRWRADSIRKSAGEYATLTNLARGRMVYGRPRRAAMINDRMRKGMVSVLATFDTNGPDFYSTTQRQAVVVPIGGSATGLRDPLTSPFTTGGISIVQQDMVNEGDSDAWPILKFHGPGHSYAFDLLQGTNVLWSIEVPEPLLYDQTLTVDTRPWVRSSTMNGNPANGRLRGTPLDRCGIPVGEFKGRLRVTDTTGQAFADIRWRDTYASL